MTELSAVSVPFIETKAPQRSTSDGSVGFDILADLERLNLVGRSHAFLNTVSQLKRFSVSKAPILLEGETGSGKELAARALHYLGNRQGKPFIPFNCGAMPESMMENELFGHRRGAYTDASTNQPGLIEQADEGTLFLDEIDSLPLHSQATLLRFLQDQKYRPLGATAQVQANVSIIAATNVEIQQQVKRGQFRADLLFRINVINIKIPPLRQRDKDILLIAEHCLRQFEQIYNLGRKVLSANSQLRLLQYDWPGNIRELQNCLHKAYLSTDGGSIHLTLPCDDTIASPTDTVSCDNEIYTRPFADARQQLLNEFEYNYLHQLMQKTQGNVSKAAQLAQKERRSLGRLLDKHGIDRQSYK